MLKDMIEMQREYDQMVFLAHGISGYESVSQADYACALMDELGELMHEIKSRWCWWKFMQKPEDKEKVLEEFVDVVHFVLMGLNARPETIPGFMHGFDDPAPFESIPAAFIILANHTRGAYNRGRALHWLARELGFSWQEVYEGYIRKNQINRERVKNGY